MFSSVLFAEGVGFCSLFKYYFQLGSEGKREVQRRWLR